MEPRKTFVMSIEFWAGAKVLDAPAQNSIDITKVLRGSMLNFCDVNRVLGRCESP